MVRGARRSRAERGGETDNGIARFVEEADNGRDK